MSDSKKTRRRGAGVTLADVRRALQTGEVSQSALARAAGLTQPAVSNIMAGADPRTETAAALVRALRGLRKTARRGVSA